MSRLQPCPPLHKLTIVVSCDRLRERSESIQQCPFGLSKPARRDDGWAGFWRLCRGKLSGAAPSADQLDDRRIAELIPLAGKGRAGRDLAEDPQGRRGVDVGQAD